MSIEFRGLEGIEERLDSLASAEQIEQALTKACLIVERSAKQKAPKKGTGDLARSITHSVKELEGMVYTPLEYAPYVEYGTGIFAEEGGRTDVPWSYQDDKGEWHTTSGMQPQPYMRPALDENREEIIRVLREGLLND
jgi:HK97 gp10 family phage protein